MAERFWWRKSIHGGWLYVSDRDHMILVATFNVTNLPEEMTTQLADRFTKYLNEQHAAGKIPQELFPNSSF